MKESTDASIKLPPERFRTSSRLAFGGLTISPSKTPKRETHSFASLLHNRFAFIVAIVIEKERGFINRHRLLGLFVTVLSRLNLSIILTAYSAPTVHQTVNDCEVFADVKRVGAAQIFSPLRKNF